jgi:3-oxoacyl-[acyl-carrier protein] reductase
MSPISFDMTGRVALLTGAGRGIGLAIARAFATAGAAIAIQDIDLTVATDAARAIEEAGGRAIPLGGDAADLSLAQRSVDDVVKQLGGLHVLVNNAAIQQTIHWLEQDAHEMVHTLSTNVVSPLLFCRAAVPIFKAQRWGRIINIGSIQGTKGNAGMLPYSLSKAAIMTMTKALSRDLAPDGITVNCIAPGWIAGTFRNRGDFPTEEDKMRKGKHIPVGRVGEPQDMAGAALLLASKAGEFISGQTIHVDGGAS